MLRLHPLSNGTLRPRVSLEVPDVYRQKVRHALRATVSGVAADVTPKLACQWLLEPGFGVLESGSTRLTSIGPTHATCSNAVVMDENKRTLGRFPEVQVRVILLGPQG